MNSRHRKRFINNLKIYRATYSHPGFLTYVITSTASSNASNYCLLFSLQVNFIVLLVLRVLWNLSPAINNNNNTNHRNNNNNNNNYSYNSINTNNSNNTNDRTINRSISGSSNYRISNPKSSGNRGRDSTWRSSETLPKSFGCRYSVGNWSPGPSTTAEVGCWAFSCRVVTAAS